MAIIFTYPPVTGLNTGDLLLISEASQTGNPTKTVTIGKLAQYIGPLLPPSGAVTGTGTTDQLTKWSAPVGSGQIEDSNIADDGVEVRVGVDFRVDGSNTDIESTKLNMLQGGIDFLEATVASRGITFIHPAGGASGIINMYYNGVAAGSRFVISRAATGGAEIELEADGDINLNRTGNGGVLIGGLGNYANDAAAAAGGVPINGLYRNGNNIQIRIV